MKTLSKVLDKVTLKDENGETVSHWYNEDIRPMPPHRRTWTGLTYFSYQSGVGIIIVTWSTGAALLGLGLNAWQAIIAVILGYTAVGALTMLGSQIGGKWHIGFPVASRFVWGMRGAAFPTLNRVVLNRVWWATESWLGMMCVRTTLGALWPSFYHIRNTFPASLPMTTGDFAAWLLFVLMCAGGIMLRPERFHWPAVATAAVNIVTALALVGWFSSKAGGPGVLFKSTESLTDVEPATESKLSWAFIHAFTTVIASQSTGVLGFADWGRYAKAPGCQRWPQGLGISLSNMVSGIMGIICASCCATIYPDAGLVWNQALLLTEIQNHETSAARAAVFFASVPILMSQVLITVSGSSVAGGIDMSGLLPKFINIRRGGYAVIIIGIAMQPWQLSNTDSKFLSVMGSYAIFLAPLTGIFHCEYYLVRKPRISLVDLYTPNSTSSYWDFHGVTIRTIISFCLGFFPFLPGYIHNITPSIEVAEGWNRLFYMCYPLGYIGTATIHYALSRFMVPKELGKVDEYDHFNTFTPGELGPFGIITGVAYNDMEGGGIPPSAHGITKNEAKISSAAQSDSGN